MKQCHACNGFVPEPVSSCPHCGEAPKKKISQFSLKQKLTTLASVSGMMITLMACYGMPPGPDCVTEDKDGDGYVVCVDKSITEG